MRSEYEADASYLEWLADTLPAHDIQNAERLRLCARRIRKAFAVLPAPVPSPDPSEVAG